MILRGDAAMPRGAGFFLETCALMLLSPKGERNMKHEVERGTFAGWITPRHSWEDQRPADCRADVEMAPAAGTRPRSSAAIVYIQAMANVSSTHA